MIDRIQFAQELLLRENIRKAIKVVKARKHQKSLVERQQETELRGVIRSLIKEANAVAASAKHANTGINFLEDLLKNSNLLSVLRTGYKSLTSNKEQRNSYRNHIEVFIKKSLAPEASLKQAPRLEEDISIDVDNPEDDPDFIDVEEDDRSDEEVERDEGTIQGADLTGRDRAYRDFKRIEKEILEVFDDLSNDEDSALFEEYLIKNLALYFDKFESELDVDVAEPEEAAAAEPGGPGTEVIPIEEPAVPEDEEVANIELQEVIKHLNIDDIIENLL